MGLRSRIKQRVRALVGREGSTGNTAPTQGSAAPPSAGEAQGGAAPPARPTAPARSMGGAAPPARPTAPERVTGSAAPPARPQVAEHSMGSAAPPPRPTSPERSTGNTAPSLRPAVPPAQRPAEAATPPAAAPKPASALRPAAPSGFPEGAVPRGRGGAVLPLKAAEADPEEEARKLEKQRRFMQRARRGVLEHIQEQGGELSMKDMHDHSERRYFIAHRAFSDMMEFFVDEGLVEYDPSTMIVRLTAKGEAFVGE